MGTLFGYAVAVALGYYVIAFWVKAARWTVKNGKDAQRRAIRLKDAVSSAMTSDPLRGEE